MKRNRFSSLWPFLISIPCFYLNHLGEKGLTTKWFLLVGSFKYVAPQYYSPCTTDLQRAILICISFSKSSLSPVKNGPRNLWSMMLKVFNWPLITWGPSDQFIAASTGVWIKRVFLLDRGIDGWMDGWMDRYQIDK